jgi:hypothetical protein
MKHIARIALALLASLQGGVAMAATVTTLSVDFESPFTVGAIGGNPTFTAGQGGWGGYSAGAIVDDQAFSGTQSLRSGGRIDTGAEHSLDPALQGDYPVATNLFCTGCDWWVQAWVWVVSGGVGARMNVTPWGWYLGISGTGTPILESAIAGQPPTELPSEGADVLDEWIFVSMVHSFAAANNCSEGQGRCIDFSIRGANVDLTYSRPYFSPGPNSTYINLSGDAYWDDVRVGTGEPPAVVPLPAAAWLMVTAFGALAARARRR